MQGLCPLLCSDLSSQGVPLLFVFFFYIFQALQQTWINCSIDFVILDVSTLAPLPPHGAFIICLKLYFSTMQFAWVPEILPSPSISSALLLSVLNA